MVACILPAALIAAILAVNHYRQEEARLAADALATARAVAADVDRELAGVQSGLFALATSPYLSANDLRAFHAQAAEALRTMNADNIVLVDPQGRQLVNTLRPFGKPVAGAAPAQVLRIFETGRPAVTNLFKGTLLQRPLVGINVPVRRDDAIRYALGAAMLPDRLSGLLAQQHLPEGWIASILDGNGAFVARSQGIERYLGEQGVPALLAASRKTRDGILEADTVEGIPMYGAFAHSGVSGWTIAIGIPREQLSARLRRALQLVIATAAALLAAGLALAWAIGRGIARAVRGLTVPARDLALDRVVTVPVLGLREADEVGQVLAEASRRLRAAAGAHERAEREARDLARRLLETEEAERRKLNRELHDRVGANLSAVSLGLSVVRSQLSSGAPGAARERLEELEKLLAQTVRHARDLMGELSPPGLADYGLLAALNAQAETMAAREGLEVAVHGVETEPRPPLAVETAFFRIAQEALSNVLKHAGTRRAQIRLAGRGDGVLAMTVSDAGAGFDPGAAPRTASWGMRTMRERAEAIGARFAIEAAPGAGTRVTVEWRRGIA